MHTLKLAEWRRFKGLTKTELAARAGVSFLTIYRLEAGHSKRPRLTTIQRLARGLGVAPHVLWAPPSPAIASDGS